MSDLEPELRLQKIRMMLNAFMEINPTSQSVQDITFLLDLIETYEKALLFYADPDTYITTQTVDKDQGEVARIALGAPSVKHQVRKLESFLSKR